MRLEFTKMEGLGNDYIYVDATRFPLDADSASEAGPGRQGVTCSAGESLVVRAAIQLSDRHFGVGADGLVLIGRSEVADFSMRMFNADGSEGLMCGNAARCIGKYVYDKGLTDKTSLLLETRSGIKRLSLHPGPDGLVSSVTVDMGPARIIQRDLELEAAGERFCGTVVDVGNPHFVILCNDAEAVDLERFGPAIENHPLFPGRINVGFVSIADPSVILNDSKVSPLPPVKPRPTGHLRVRVWERGSGATLACGTGACATAVAMVTAGITTSPCNIRMDGGSLTVHYNADGTLLMEGPAVMVFDGVAEI